MLHWYERGLSEILHGDMGTGGAPTAFDDYGPTPAQLAEVQKDRDAKAAAAAQRAVAERKPKGGFTSLFTSDASAAPAGAGAQAGAGMGRVTPSASAPGAPAGQPPVKWWMREKAGLPVYGWIFGTFGVVAVGAGVYEAVWG